MQQSHGLFAIAKLIFYVHVVVAMEKMAGSDARGEMSEARFVNVRRATPHSPAGKQLSVKTGSIARR